MTCFKKEVSPLQVELAKQLQWVHRYLSVLCVKRVHRRSQQRLYRAEVKFAKVVELQFHQLMLWITMTPLGLQQPL